MLLSSHVKYYTSDLAMPELLTAKQLQEILQVDRTTIYRMADSGRLPGIKVGGQWRFSRPQIETWLQSQSTSLPIARERAEEAVSTGQNDVGQMFPVECVQLIQDSFADLLRAMLLLIDLDGHAITRPSNACGLHKAIEAHPKAYQRCIRQWLHMAQEPALAPRYQTNPLGLLCARGLIRVGGEIRAMLVVGDIAPESWPPAADELVSIATRLEIAPDVLVQHATEVHCLDQAGQDRALGHVQRVADIFAHIAAERSTLFSRLQRIAEITQM